MPSLLPPPPSVRRGIPFYHAKTEAEFRDDVYERYDELVTRQAALHLVDELHGGYPQRDLLDFVLGQLPEGEGLAVADVGCSVGRLIGEIAARHPGWDCYGFDLSYQMLRVAHDSWVGGQSTELNLLRYGFGTPRTAARRLPNLTFALARAGKLPLPDNCLDALVHTFLLDRVADVAAVLLEFARLLRPAAPMVCVTPLNFLNPAQWRRYDPPVRLLNLLVEQGWEVTEWTDPYPVHEPMDRRGNAVRWNCLRFVVRRRN